MNLTPSERELLSSLPQRRLPGLEQRRLHLVQLLRKDMDATRAHRSGRFFSTRWAVAFVLTAVVAGASGFAVAQQFVQAGDSRLAAEVAHVRREVALPPGVIWPDLRFRSENGGRLVLYEIGNGYARANGFAQCAWYNELLAAKASGDGAREARALAAIEGIPGWPRYTEVFVDGADWNAKYLMQYRVGDDGGFRQFLAVNC